MGSLRLEEALAMPSRLGWHYNIRNGEGPDHVVVSDASDLPGCVTVRNGGGQTFPLARKMIDQFAAPPGRIWDDRQQGFVLARRHGGAARPAHGEDAQRQRAEGDDG